RDRRNRRSERWLLFRLRRRRAPEFEIASTSGVGAEEKAMDLTGEYQLAATRQKVWAALNDADVLRRCIPGCKELEQKSPSEFAAIVALKIGPVSATFKGSVNLEDIDAPNGYRIVGQGNGGVVGFAKGGATVRLADNGSGTLLSYVAKAEVGGKLASLG